MALDEMTPERRRRQIRHDLVDDICRRLEALEPSEHGVRIRFPWLDGVGRHTSGGPNGRLEVQARTLEEALERLLYALRRREQERLDYLAECRQEEEEEEIGNE